MLMLSNIAWITSITTIESTIWIQFIYICKFILIFRNPGFKTIEEDLLAAFVKAGIVRPDHIEQPGAKVCLISYSWLLFFVCMHEDRYP